MPTGIGRPLFLRAPHPSKKTTTNSYFPIDTILNYPICGFSLIILFIGVFMKQCEMKGRDMPDQPIAESSAPTSTKKGRVAFVGTGLKSIAHMTLESVSEIENADIVFYHATDGVTASFIQSLNPNTHDLYQYYGNGKRRNATYIQMSEVILQAVREGKNVVGVYYGHPGVFVKPIRRVMGLARQEGHEAIMYPGITSMDYLFADLEVDPSKNGCQILEASDMFVRNRRLCTDSHVIILQIGAFGDNTFSFNGYPKKKFDLLVEYLIEYYGPDASCTVYRGSNFPGIDSEKATFSLRELLDKDVQAKHIKGVSTLYVPPGRSETQ